MPTGKVDPPGAEAETLSHEHAGQREAHGPLELIGAARGVRHA
jgi:hypothetical protein